MTLTEIQKLPGAWLHSFPRLPLGRVTEEALELWLANRPDQELERETFIV